MDKADLVHAAGILEEYAKENRYNIAMSSVKGSSRYTHRMKVDVEDVEALAGRLKSWAEQMADCETHNPCGETQEL